MISAHHTSPNQMSIGRQPLLFDKALTVKPVWMSRGDGTETNCFWFDASLRNYLSSIDWEWLCSNVMLWISAPELKRLLTVRSEWSRK